MPLPVSLWPRPAVVCGIRRPSSASRFAGISDAYTRQFLTPRGVAGQTTSWLREPTVLLPAAMRIRETFPEGMPADNPIRVYAASDGSDAWSLAHALRLTGLLHPDSKPMTAYPIDASDLHPGRVAVAQEGYVEVFDRELELADQAVQAFARQNDAPDPKAWHNRAVFSQAVSIPIPLAGILNAYGLPFCQPEHQWYRVSDALREPVTFREADIEADLQANPLPQDGPSVVLFRNVWGYMDKEDPQKCQRVARLLGQQMAPGSLLVTGKLEAPLPSEVALAASRMAKQLAFLAAQRLFPGVSQAQMEAALGEFSPGDLPKHRLDVPALLRQEGFEPVFEVPRRSVTGHDYEGQLWIKQ